MQLSVQKYAKQAGLSRFAVYKQIREGRLPKGVRSKVVADRLIIILPNKN